MSLLPSCISAMVLTPEEIVGDEEYCTLNSDSLRDLSPYFASMTSLQITATCFSKRMGFNLLKQFSLPSLEKLDVTSAKRSAKPTDVDTIALEPRIFPKVTELCLHGACLTDWGSIALANLTSLELAAYPCSQPLVTFSGLLRGLNGSNALERLTIHNYLGVAALDGDSVADRISLPALSELTVHDVHSHLADFVLRLDAPACATIRLSSDFTPAYSHAPTRRTLTVSPLDGEAFLELAGLGRRQGGHGGPPERERSLSGSRAAACRNAHARPGRRGTRPRTAP